MLRHIDMRADALRHADDFHYTCRCAIFAMLREAPRVITFRDTPPLPLLSDATLRAADAAAAPRCHVDAAGFSYCASA